MRDDGSPTVTSHRVDRRTLLACAGAGVASLAGCSLLDRGDDATATEVDEDRARELAVQFAPTLYFDVNERWFPTDPRPYASERDGETVVDGFDAFDGYTARYAEGGAPPDPTVFYNVVRYADSPLAVVQYWYYSAFDQFTTNFHWHDWEVLHVFVDVGEEESESADSATPQLYVASSHSRKVPNNEFLDPEPGRVPRILSELGSHSSALSVNDVLDRFQRFPIGDTLADINNSTIKGIGTLAEVPLAYGLPRDEGGRLPFVVPELDEAPIYEHERLPSVDQDDMVDESLTVRAFDELASPPEDLPGRSTGLVFDHADRDDPDGDVAYELVPTSELEHVAAFIGPQLSFEFSIPRFAEDAVASHLTTTSTPWTQPRYENPAADISDPVHRAALADRYDAIGEPAPINSVVAVVTRAVTTDDAPENEGLTTEESSVESVALLESDPEAVPTFGGVAIVQGVPEGEHRLTVNGAGSAPHSESVTVSAEGDRDGDAGGSRTTAAGVEGEIPLVGREDATKLEVDTEGTDRDLTDLAVEDDFAGRLYDAPLSGPDAVYVHRGGAYAVEVRDADDEVGAFRVNPDPSDDAPTRIDEPRTGKAVLASYVADVTEETRAAVEAAGERENGGGLPGPVGGLTTALAAVAEAARRAAARAEAGNRGLADESLETVSERLERVRTRLAEARSDLPEPLANATERRLEQSSRRSEQALDAQKL